jgi:hypothetical protein
MPGDRDHDRGGLEVGQMLDELELLFWSQRGLEEDHLARVPAAGACLRGTDPLGRNPEASRGRLSALGEQKVVFDYEEGPGHGCRIAG